MDKLTNIQIDQQLQTCSQWQQVDDCICRKFRFGDFAAAMGFMMNCALVADKLDHHPNWENVYNRVNVSLTTHSIKGLSALDFELARAFDAIFASHSR